MVPKGKSRLVGNLDMPERSHKALPLRKKVCVCVGRHTVYIGFGTICSWGSWDISPTDKGGDYCTSPAFNHLLLEQIVGLIILFYSRDECKAITKHPFGLQSMFPLCE